MAVKQFEELIIWQRARELTKAIYIATKGDGFATDYDLSKQIRRASVSVMSNVAKGSCAEVRCQLYIALDVGYMQPEEFETLIELANETGRILNGLLLSIKQKLCQTKN